MLLIEKGPAIPNDHWFNLGLGHDELMDMVIMLDRYYRGMR